MIPTISEAMLVIGSSLAATILAKVTGTTALALVAARLARRSRAAVRHVLLAAAFAVLLVLPIASIVAPSIRVALPVAAQYAPGSTTFDATTGTELPAAVDARIEAVPAIAQPRTLSMSTVLLAGWLAGVTLFLLPMAGGLWQVRALRRSGLPCREGRSIVDSLTLETGIQRPVDVLLHESVSGPMTSGVAHPAIILPTDARSWPHEDLHRAIVHELEHVRRGDWMSQCLVRAVCACYWFHPLVWIARRQLVLEAERACDDAVVRRADAAAYADQLIVLARRLSGGTTQLAMAGRHDLATRVRALLDSRQRRGQAGVRWIAFAFAIAALVAAAVSPLTLVARQAQTDKLAPSQRFEAASIKPCSAEEAGPEGRARGGMGGTNATFSPGRMRVPCVTLEQLIYLAYAGSGAWPDNQLVNVTPGGASDTTKVRGGPAWVHSQHDKFAVEATAPGATQRNVLLGSMLRTLLEDRFHLTIHRETEDVPMFGLKVAKNGLKIKPMRPGDCDERQGDERPDPNAAKPMCGSLLMLGHGPNTVWTWGGATLQALAYHLSGTLGRYVIDQTGVPDEFIIRLEFHPDENTPGIRPTPEGEADTSAPQAASIFTALEQQIGVNVDRTRGPRGFLVIDHVEPLTPNSEAGTVAAPGQAAGAAGLKFEVVSIKPCEPGERGSSAGGGGRSGGGGALNTSPGRITVRCMTLVEMATRAYVQFGNPPPVNHAKRDAETMTGGPAWARADRFTIEAKADGAADQATMMGAMLRAVLEDRFQLKIHPEFREVPALALTVAASGIKLKPADPSTCTAPDPNNPVGPRTIGADGLVRVVGGNDKPLCVGGVGRNGPDLTYNVTGQDFDHVSRTLAMILDRPVIDRTGVTGQYSFHVEFANDENLLVPPGAPAESSDVPPGPSIFTAFEKQLGLKLVPIKAQQGFLVIDRVERPSSNERTGA